MLLLAADSPAAVPLAPPSFVDRARGYAYKAERIIDAPVYDTAAILGVDVLWLGGVILMVKAVSLGVWYEFFRKPPGACLVCPRR